MGSRVDNIALARWENPLVDTLLVEVDTEYEVFRVIKKLSGGYILYRWFTLAGDWHVSVDIPEDSAEAMITHLAVRVNASHNR